MQMDQAFRSIEESSGFHGDGLRMLLSVIHGLALRHSAAGLPVHLEAEDILEGFLEAIRERFGVLSVDVLSEWGLDTPGKVGQAVFAMVEIGLLARGEDDDQADFEDSKDFPPDWNRFPILPEIREQVRWTGG